MPSFSAMFEKSMGQPIKYKNLELKLADKFPVKSGDKLLLSIESTDSETFQGISIEIAGHCEMNGEILKKGKRIIMVFLEKSNFKNYNPKHIELTVYTKTGFVWVQNIWETEERMGNRYFASGHTGAAMIVEEIKNGRRYRCNDWHPDENFDDIIFTVKNLGPPTKRS